MKKTSVTLAILLGAGAALLADQSPADLDRARQLFRNFDTNGDGSISLDEYRAGMAGNMASSRIERVFKEKDRNGDGKLNLDELFYAPADQHPANPPVTGDVRKEVISPQRKDDPKPVKSPAEQQAERLFRNFDTNGDGHISLEEYRAGMVGNMSPSRMEKVFQEKDRNGDGNLSLEELLYAPGDQRAATPAAASGLLQGSQHRGGTSAGKP